MPENGDEITYDSSMLSFVELFSTILFVFTGGFTTYHLIPANAVFLEDYPL
jgi:hypothetical protein